MDTEVTTTVEPTTEVKKLEQREAVFKFVTEFIPVKQEGQSLKSLLTKEIKKAVKVRLIGEIKAGTVACSKEMDDKKLNKYCSSLISNWLKKDSRYQ